MWIRGLTPVGVGLNCIDSRDGGRIPEAEDVLPEWLNFSELSLPSFVNSNLAARGITPKDIKLDSPYAYTHLPGVILFSWARSSHSI